MTLTSTASSAGPVLGYIIEAGSASGLGDLASLVAGTMTTLLVNAVPNGTYSLEFAR